VVEVWIGANARFAAAAPEIAAFLRNYRTSAALVSEALGHMKSANVDDAAAADRFLRTHPEVWRAWLPPAVAAKVETALQ
jgi:glycine betaine/proline transport system substrate-binding protein